jgi:hypothetical protein
LPFKPSRPSHVLRCRAAVHRPGKDQIVAFLQQLGENAKADQAQQELPGQVDTEKDAGLLTKLGINRSELLGGFGGRLSGELGF